MKKMMWVALVAAVMVGCAQQPKYTISGQVEGVEMLYLTNNDGVIDSAKVEHGAFLFEGTVAEPKVAYIANAADVRAASVRALCIVEEGAMTFGVTESGDYVVTGTKANDAYKAMNDEAFKLVSEYRNEATSDERRAAIEQEFEALGDAALEANKDNLFGVMQLQNAAYSLPATEVKEMIATFTPEMQQTAMMQKIQEMVDQKMRTEPGQPYIDFAQADKEGNEVALKTVVENPANKYVLLDFWASWCGPCMAEVPHLKEAYDAYKAKGFEIFGVSLDNNGEAWWKAVEEKGLNWLHVSDLKGWQNAAAADYAVRSIPSNYLIDCATGTIVAVNLRGEEVKAKLAELLD